VTLACTRLDIVPWVSCGIFQVLCLYYPHVFIYVNTSAYLAYSRNFIALVSTMLIKLHVADLSLVKNSHVLNVPSIKMLPEFVMPGKI